MKSLISLHRNDFALCCGMFELGNLSISCPRTSCELAWLIIALHGDSSCGRGITDPTIDGAGIRVLLIWQLKPTVLTAVPLMVRVVLIIVEEIFRPKNIGIVLLTLVWDDHILNASIEHRLSLLELSHRSI